MNATSDPASPAPLASAVQTLLENPARAGQLGAAGRRRAEATFGLPAHVEAVERAYAELLGVDRVAG